VRSVRRILGEATLGMLGAAARVRAKGFSLASSGAFGSFGARSVIQPPVRLSGHRRIAIGSDVFVGSGSWLQVIGDGDGIALELDDGVRIAGNCVLSSTSYLRLGRKVLLARNVYIADHSHAFADSGRAILEQGIDRVAPVVIGDGAWLGQNVVIGPGVTIGPGAVVGANSVVLSDVPARSVVVGAPAAVVRMLDPVPEPAT
jgi:acetyltransferase-like isoleucine patch superfamily enzyme